MPVYPEQLRLNKTLEMVAAPRGKTFFYRHEHKRVIEPGWFDMHWLDVARGPTVYAVTDASGATRYVGRHLANTPLRSRWFRRGYIHHQRSSRQHFLDALDSGRGPLSLWSAPISTLLPWLPASAATLPLADLASQLEALWISRWKDELAWNTKSEQPRLGFTDGDYWRTTCLD